jgi:hypothetical protein
MKTKISELEGVALNWAVAKSLGLNVDGVLSRLKAHIDDWKSRPVSPVSQVEEYCNSFWSGIYLSEKGSREAIPNYSTSWGVSGVLIEKYAIDITSPRLPLTLTWAAQIGDVREFGNTPLLAAMRCIVCSTLGEYIEVPPYMLDEN